MAYVYEHWRPDLDQPFWVGKGTGNRCRIFRRRHNPHYAAVIDKLDASGLTPEVRIIADGLSDMDAFSLEIERISYWRGIGIRLCNYAEGGRGGMSGVIRSVESRTKQSATSTGRKLSPQHLQKLLARIRSPEGRAATKKLHLGRKRSDETKEKIRIAKLNHWSDCILREKLVTAIRNNIKPVSEKTRAKMRAAKTPEARAKISAAVKEQWKNPAFRSLVSATMRKTNDRRRDERCGN